jgi:hypothetical protein
MDVVNSCAGHITATEEPPIPIEKWLNQLVIHVNNKEARNKQWN